MNGRRRTGSRSRPLDGLKLYTLESLRGLLGLSEYDFKVILRNSDRFYFSFDKVTIKKTRRCVDTKPTLKCALERLNTQLQRVRLPDYLHGGIPGRSTKSNARPHAGQLSMVCADIKEFFPSVNVSMVEDVFKRKLRCSKAVSKALAEICTFRGSLPTGSPVSSSIANFAILDLAYDLSQLASRHNGFLTQYVDDIVISGPPHIIRLKGLVKKIIEDNGFVCHPEKLVVFLPEDERVVTGVRVDGGIDIPSTYLREVSKHIRCLEDRCAGGASITDKELRSIRGKAYYVRSLNPGAGKTLLRRIEKIEASCTCA